MLVAIAVPAVNGASATLTAAIEPKAGGNLEFSIRNNYPGIQTYHLEASGEGLEFFPPKADISVGPTDERPFSLRVFTRDDAAGLLDWRLRVTGGAQADVPVALQHFQGAIESVRLSKGSVSIEGPLLAE